MTGSTKEALGHTCEGDKGVEWPGFDKAPDYGSSLLSLGRQRLFPKQTRCSPYISQLIAFLFMIAVSYETPALFFQLPLASRIKECHDGPGSSRKTHGLRPSG